MASIISAGTSAGTAIAISGDTSGNLSFQTQAGANTITIPNTSGIAMVSGNIPAFSASKTSGDQAIATSTTTKITFDTEDFDTANCFSSSRFTPNVAGYYQFTFMGQGEIITSGRVITWIYKSGSLNFFKEENLNGPSTTYPSRFVSALLYANGTTDYFEIYVRQESGSNKSVFAGTTATYFQGYLVRAT
jgi:hypothetical protein